MNGVKGTRREVLVALLGLPSLAACRGGGAKDPTWDGSFVERSSEDGHRFRDGFDPRPPGGAIDEEIPVLILGAGVAGLSAARELALGGSLPFRVLELETHAGGTAVSGSSPVSAFPWGAHYLPTPTAKNPDLVAFLEEVGTVIGRDGRGRPVFEETHLCAAPKERLFYHGMWYADLFPYAGAHSADLEQLSRFKAEIDRLVALPCEDGRPAFALPIERSSEDPRLSDLEGMSMVDWLAARRFDSPLLLWYVEYGCRDDFGTELAQTSAWYGLHYFAARREEKTGESAEFLTWPEGNGFLVRQLERRLLPDQLLLDWMVTSVEPHDEGRRVRVVAWHRREKRAKAWVAERVIFALPSYLRSRILARFETAPPYDVSYAPWLVANVHLAERPRSRGVATAWDNVIYGSRSLGYVVATHQDVRDRGRGPTVWTWYLPLSGKDSRSERRSLQSLSWAEACDVLVHDLSSCHLDFKENIRRIDVMRWGHGMVRPEAGGSSRKVRLRAGEPFGPIHFAHSDLSGVALFEEAFFHGTRAAREVLRSL